MKFSSWQRLHSGIKFLKYLSMLLTVLWLSITVPGCNLFQSTVSTGSAPESSQTVSQTIASPQRFDGTTIDVVAYKATIYKAIQRHIAEFETLTGAKVNLTEASVGEIYNILKKDWSGKASKYDMAIIVPAWQTDFANAGDLEDLTARVKADDALQWDDIAPIFRDVSATYKGRTYSIPVDGDLHMVYYRNDLLKQAGLSPPQTWDDYLKFAKQFNGQDLNGDGKADYGSCISNRPHENIAAMFTSIAAPFLQSQGVAQGAFFDPDTMKPLVNNPGFGRALEIYKQTMNYGVPNAENLSQPEARELFITGRCALTMDWGDIGSLAIDQSISKVTDKVGAVVTPGSTQILDRKSGRLVACDKFTCPYAIDGVNHAPHAANIGWTGVIHSKASPKDKDAAYAFLSYISQPAQSNIDVTIGATGLNPYRISQFENVAPWLKSGMSSEAANNYLGAIGVSLKSPNMVLSLSIPYSQQYVDQALDDALADFLADKITKEEAMQQIEQEWEQLTNNVGRKSQKAAYRFTLGLQS